jgi:predicted metalloprotease with PDZ domain
MKRFLFLALLVPTLSAAQVHYTLETMPETKDIAVTITTDNKADKIAYFLPAWVPGFYVILNHQQNIFDVTATDSTGQALKIDPQANPSEWVVDPPRTGRSNSVTK